MLLTEESLSAYLKTINLADDRVKRTIGAIQTLHNTLMEELFLLLVNGNIAIDELFRYDINNNSIKVLIDSKHKSQNTIQAQRNFYKNKVEKLPLFKRYFHTERQSNSIYFLNRLMGGMEKYFVYFALDEFGFKKNTFKSISLVSNLYNECTANSEYTTTKSTFLALVDSKATTHRLPGLGLLFRGFIKTLESYNLLADAEDTLRTKERINPLLLFIMKERYRDLLYINLIDNYDDLLMNMASDYSKDTKKDGFYTLSRLVNDNNYTYESLFTQNLIVDENEEHIINSLSRIMFIRYQFYSRIYSVQNTTTNITRESTVYNDLINLFVKARELGLVLIKILKANYPEVL